MKNQSIYRFIFCGLFLLLGWIAACQNVLAQAQPVQANLQLSPPYSVYLPDYGIPGSEQMRLQLLLRDIAEPEYPVRLHLVVEGSGIRIETNPAFHPQPIYLQGGIPTMVSGEVLGPYLESSHLLFSGISRQNYEQKGSLPEGMYTFSVRVLDYRRTDVVLSNEAVFTAWLMLNDPPRINTPICGSELPLNELQSVLFQWMSGSAGSPNAAFDTEYEFTLVEVRPQGRNPEDAIRSAMPLYQQTTDFTSIVYGISEPPLIPGQQYAFRVKASDKRGRDLFKNQGYSPVCTFTYGDIDPLEPPEGINVYAEVERRARISWEMSINPDSYRVEYRKQPKEGENFSWFTTETTQDELTLYDLEPETHYEVRVASLFQGFASRYTQIQTFTTPALRIAVCGERPDIRSYEDVAPLPTAIAGQYWQVGNFEMQLLEVRGGDGTFSGLGSITVPYLGLQVPVKFDQVQVNRNREVFRGEVHALSEEIDSFRKRWTEENPLQENTDEPNFQQAETTVSTEEATPLAPETLNVEGTISDVTINAAGQIVISREDGSSQTYTQPQDQETGEKQATTILDAQGNRYVVDKQGGVSKGGSNERSKEAMSVSANALLIEVLDEFEEATQAWLRVHGKGPLSQAEMRTLQDLPQGIPADEDLVGPLVDYILPEVRQNHEPFLEAIEQHNPQAIRLMRNVNALDELNAEEQAEVKLSIAEQLVQNGLAYVIKEFLYELGLNGACLDQGIQKGKSVYWEKLKAGFSIEEVAVLAFNAGTTETLFCLSSRENCPGKEYWGQFGCGAVHALVEEIDLNGMVDGLLALRKAYFKNRISCLTEGSSFIMVGPSDEEESLRLMLSCALGVDISIAEMQEVYPSIKQYVTEHWDDPYTHGQATIFLLSIVSPTKLTKAAKLKLIHKLKGNKLFATKLDDLKALSEAVEEGKDLGKVVDELRNVKNGKVFSDANNALAIGGMPDAFGQFRQFSLKINDEVKNLRAGNFAKKIDSRINHFITQDGQYYIKHNPDTRELLLIDVQKKEYIGYVIDEADPISKLQLLQKNTTEEYEKVISIWKRLKGLDNATELMVKGKRILLPQDKITVILGKYFIEDNPFGYLTTKDFLEELGLNNLKYWELSKNLTPSTQRIHMLNLPREIYRPIEKSWWTAFNAQLIDDIIKNPNKYNIVILTDVVKSTGLDEVNKILRGVYAEEINTLYQYFDFKIQGEFWTIKSKN